MSLTPKMIKLIYCYLVCLFLVISLILNLCSLIDQTIKIIRFEDSYLLNHSLTSRQYFKQEDLKNMSREEAEILRQKEVAENKYQDLKQLKNNIFKEVIYVILISIFLLIHILIIRRSRFT